MLNFTLVVPIYSTSSTKSFSTMKISRQTSDSLAAGSTDIGKKCRLLHYQNGLIENGWKGTIATVQMQIEFFYSKLFLSS